MNVSVHALRLPVAALLTAALVALPAASSTPVRAPERSVVTSQGGPSQEVKQDHPVLLKMDWRSVLAFYRRTADLPRLSVRSDWLAGARAHARYMVKNRTIGHSESSRRPHYSSAGDEAARNGNLSLALGMSQGMAAREVIERWMAAPFHAAAILDPRLRQTAFAIYRERKKGEVSQGAVLDVSRGRTGSRSNRVVVWPGQGMQIPINTYSGNEWPDPLASCDGYAGEVGLPILAQFPRDVRIASTSLSGPGGELEHCAFDGHSYKNRDKGDQRYARALLRQRDTVVIVPRAPLRDFQTFAAEVTTTDGQTVQWSFSIGEVEPPYDARVTGAPASRAFQDRTSFGVAWTATDEESGPARFDIRWRRAGVKGGFRGYTRWLSGATGRSADFDADPGYTYCFSARATDRAGNRSGWGRETCTTMPMRAIDLESKGLWAPVFWGEFYSGRASMSLSTGSTLRTGIVRARRLALIATSNQTAGVVDVLWNGKRLRRIDLDGREIRTRQQLELEPFRRVRTGRVTIKVVRGERVLIEGLGVARW